MRVARIAVVLVSFALAGTLTTDAVAKPKHCKKGYVLKTVKKKGKKVKVCKKKKASKKPAGTTPTNDQTQTGGDQTQTGGNPTGTGGDTTGTGGQPTGTGGTNQAPPSQTTRDDAAGQQAMATAGDLLLERAEFGSSGQTATYYRIWFLQNGYFKYNEIAWNSVSGESCTKTQRGTWAFKEGYTYTAQGGGTIVKVTLNLDNGQSGDDLVTFNNSDPNAVFVGVNGVRFDRNPQINDNCGG